MALPASAVQIPDRASCYGTDGVHYPDREERTVPLSERALRLIAYLYEALRLAFRGADDVYVGADQFLYWEPGNTRKRVAPDGYVIQGVPKEPPRRVIRIWEESAPSLVVEVSSNESRKEDRGSKLALYRDVLRCPEYLIYDEGREELLFFRLDDGAYQPVAPEADGRFHSHTLNVSFAPDPDVLVRVFDLDGRPVPDLQELDEQFTALDEQYAALNTRHQELQQREDEERRRAEDLAAENERLRAELERLRGDAQS